MNKMIPYIIVFIALIAGFLLKNYMGLNENANEQETINPVSNKIDNRFKTLLIYPKKNLLNTFVLRDHNGNEFTAKSLEKKWNLIFIGYTNCPDVCPNTLNQLTQIYEGLSSDIKKQYQVIFFSVDPSRDTPEHLKRYLDFFNEDFVGISGDKNQIDTVVRNLGGIYTVNSEEGEFYTVDHSARIFIVDPKAQRFGIIDNHSIVGNKIQLIKDLTQLTIDY